MSRRSHLLCASLLIALVACDDDPSGVGAASTLEVRPALLRVVEGESFTLDTRFFDDAGRVAPDRDVDWWSLDPSIVTVDDGAAFAEGHGWARVVAETDDGELGDTALIAAGVRFARVTAGDDFTCGWTDEGAGWCWSAPPSDGFYAGLVGAGTGESSATPARVAGNLGFEQIDAGDTHACGIAGGSVYCWGHNRGGALGYASCAANSCDTPLDVGLTGTFTDVSAPSWFDRTTCATGPDGLHCWGASAHGAMGLDPIPCAPYCNPMLVSETLTGDVAMGRQHGCALDAQGQAHCWGDDRYGQLGLGSQSPDTACAGYGCALSPHPIVSAERFVQLESGTYFTCGRTEEGRVFCWGNYDAFGSDIRTAPGRAPVDVSGDLRFTTIGAGWFHVCGVETSGDLYCWGQATWDLAMGLPAGTEYVTIEEPRRVDAGGAQFTAVDVGPRQTCAVATDGSIRCMGTGPGLGQGTWLASLPRPTPVLPPGPVPEELNFFP